jgi:hypothetical protein
MSVEAENQTGKLSPELKDKFELAPGAGAGEYHWQGHRADLRTIQLATATKLVNNGFPYLVEIAASATEKKQAKQPAGA